MVKNQSPSSSTVDYILLMTIAGTVPPHRLLTTPSRANGESDARLSARVEQDCFNRTSSPPKTPQRYHEPHVESATHFSPGQEQHSAYESPCKAICLSRPIADMAIIKSSDIA